MSLHGASASSRLSAGPRRGKKCMKNPEMKQDAKKATSGVLLACLLPRAKRLAAASGGRRRASCSVLFDF